MTSPRGDIVRMTPLMGLAVAPLAVMPLLTVFIVGSWVLGREPFASTPVLTLSESVAIRDDGEVLRLIEQEGADPNRAYSVRAGILRAEPMSLLPLEAAVSSRRAEIVRLLVRHGATLSADGRDRLVCAAQAAGADEVVEELMATVPEGASERPSCDAAAR